MSATTMAETVENISPTAESPPIASLLPLLQLVLTGSSLLFHLGVRFLLTLVYPLHITWTIVHALLSPILVVVNIAFTIVLSAPFSITRMVVVALYPVYAFCAVACIIGALVGILGHYISTAILSVLSRSTYFARPPGASPATRPSSPQAMLRKRKRKIVRLQ